MASIAAAVEAQGRKPSDRWPSEVVNAAGEITPIGPRVMFAFWFFAAFAHRDVFSEFIDLYVVDCGTDEELLNRFIHDLTAEYVKQERRRKAKESGIRVVATAADR